MVAVKSGLSTVGNNLLFFGPGTRLKRSRAFTPSALAMATSFSAPKVQPHHSLGCRALFAPKVQPHNSLGQRPGRGKYQVKR